MKDTKEDSEFTFYSEVKSSRKMQKEKILDESFKKAERSKGIKAEDKKGITKKQPFLKLGIFFIIIAVIALVIINFLPWFFIRYDAEYGTIQEFYYKDFKNKDDSYYQSLENIFDSQCTNYTINSNNFIGISKDDFFKGPKISSNAFYVLILSGLIFTIISIIDYLRHYSKIIISIIHSLFATTGVVIGTFIILSNLKFLSVHFIIFFNKAFIETSGATNIRFIFFAPLFLIIISIAIVLISVITININLRELDKKRKSRITSLDK